MDWQKEDTVAALSNKRASLASLQRQVGRIIAEVPGISLESFWPGHQNLQFRSFQRSKDLR